MTNEQYKQMLSEFRKAGEVHHPALSYSESATINNWHGFYLLAAGALDGTRGEFAEVLYDHLPMISCNAVTIITRQSKQDVIKGIEYCAEGITKSDQLNVFEFTGNEVDLAKIPPMTALFVEDIHMLKDCDFDLLALSRKHDIALVVMADEVTDDLLDIDAVFEFDQQTSPEGHVEGALKKTTFVGAL